MPKPISERKTSNPLGMKINSVMREKGMEGDYAALAAIFGVKTPSVYDWITHGRLGKERYARLVEWSGKGLNWWFDVPDPCAPCTPPQLLVADRNGVYSVTPAPDKSPFQRISAEEWGSLAPHVVREIETYALGLIAGMKIGPDLKRQNGA